MINKNRILHGTNGRVYFDGVEIAEIQSFQATEQLNFEDVNINGSFAVAHRFLSSNIEGTCTVHKVNSALAKQYKNVHKTGVVPEITITGSMSDPQSKSAQRVAFYGVQFTENSLIDFENANISNQDMPFVADDYELLEALDD